MLVKAVLKEEDVQKFEAIQRKHGVLHKSEVIRICINHVYENLERKEAGS